MSLVRHNLPVLLTLGLILFLVGSVAIWAFLWPRVGLVRATLLAGIPLWVTFVLGSLLSPKRRYRGGGGRPRSCKIELLPDHLLGAVTNQHRLATVLLFLPLGLLVVLGARGRARIVTAGSIAVLPPLVEAAQYVLPALRRPCSTLDGYDGWAGMASGAVLGVVLLVAAQRLRLNDSNARHRLRRSLPTAGEVLRMLWPPDQAGRVREDAADAAPTFVPSGAGRRHPASEGRDPDRLERKQPGDNGS